MSNCCVGSVPPSDSSFKAMQGPVFDWQARLTAGLNRMITDGEDFHPQQTLFVTYKLYCSLTDFIL
jgi:hypothetical protein